MLAGPYNAPTQRRQEESFLASSGSRGLLAILGFPWPVNASLQSLPLASHGFLPCVSVWHFSFTRDTLRGLRDTQHDLIFVDYICQDLISKYKHIHRCQGPGPPLISLGTQFNPSNLRLSFKAHLAEPVVLTEVAPSVDQGCSWEHLSDSCQRDVLLTSSIR